MMSNFKNGRKRGSANLLIISLVVVGSNGAFQLEAEAGWRHIGLSGLNVNEVHVVGSMLFVGTSDGAYRKLRFDASPSWIPIGLQGMDVLSLAVLPPDTVIASTSTGANVLQRSTNGGASWEAIDSNLTESGVRPVFDLAAVTGLPTAIYAATTGTGDLLTVQRSTDCGDSWNSVWAGLLPATSVFQFIYVDARFHSVLWAGGETGFFSPWLVRSYDSGANWNWAPVLASGDNRCHDVAISPNDSEKVWVSTEGQVQHSSNGGASWTIVHTSNHYLYSIAIDTVRPDRLYTSGGAQGQALRYAFTTDRGSVWHQVNGPSSAGIICRDLDVHSEPGRTFVYFATSDGVLEFLDPVVYICGDANADGIVTSSDIIFVVNRVFKSGPPAAPFPSVADVDCGGTATSADIIEIVNVVFKSGLFSCAACPSEVL